MATSQGSRRLTSTAPHAPALRRAHLGIRGGLRPGWPLPAGPLGGRHLLCIYGETGGGGEALTHPHGPGAGGLSPRGCAPPAPPPPPSAHTPADSMAGLALCVCGALLESGPRPGAQKETQGQQAGANTPAEWAMYLCLGPTGELELEAGPGVQRGQWEPGLTRSAGVPPGSRCPRNVPWSQL